MSTELGFWGRIRGGVEVPVQGFRDLMGGIRHAQVVDGSTLQQVEREGLIPRQWESSWYIARNCRSKIEMSVRKMRFPDMGLPGVENVPTPRGVILRAFPDSPGQQKRQNQHFRGFWRPPRLPHKIGCGGARKGLYTRVIILAPT